jgi:hypothetical protein
MMTEAVFELYAPGICQDARKMRDALGIVQIGFNHLSSIKENRIMKSLKKNLLFFKGQGGQLSTHSIIKEIPKGVAMKSLKITLIILTLSLIVSTTAFGWGQWERLYKPNNYIKWAKAISNQDGRLELFVIEAPTGTLWHKWQLSPGSWTWSSWKPMGKPLGADIDQFRDLAVGRNEDGRLEVFVKTKNHGIWHRYQLIANGYWSHWESLGSPSDTNIAYDIVVTHDNANRLWLWSTGGDGNIWFRNQVQPNSGWCAWGKIEKPFKTQILVDKPAVSKNANGLYELFSVGLDGGLYYTSPFIPFMPIVDWNSMHTPGNKDLDWGDAPIIYPNQDGRLEVFMVGNTKMWHIWQEKPAGEWIPEWVPLPDLPIPASEVYFGPEAIANADGRIELFISGPSGDVYHIWQNRPNGNWSQWTPLRKARRGELEFSLLTNARNANGKIEVFVRDMKGEIWHIKQ